MRRFQKAAVIAWLSFLFCTSAQATEREEWHKLMRDASFAANIQNFALAGELFKKSLAVSQDLACEERFLTLLALGSLAEDLGKYDEAKPYYRQALEISQDDEAAYALIDVLYKQKESEESVSLRRKYQHRTIEEGKKAKSAMSVVQKEIGREWHERLTPRSEVHKIDAFATQGAWTRAYVYVSPGLKRVVAYVRDSSGDEKIDAASIGAAESLQTSRIAENLPHGAMIEFTFDYGVKAPDSPKAMHPRAEHRYRECRHLLTWQQTHLGPEHPEVAINLSGAASLLKESNSPQAEIALAKACEIWKANGVVCRSTYTTLKTYGEVLLKNHKDELALGVLRTAKSTADELFGSHSWESSECNDLLIKALKKTGHSAEAKEVASQSK